MHRETAVMELRSRCAQGLHQKIKAAAEESFRSMSAEIAHRLQKSFERDEQASKACQQRQGQLAHSQGHGRSRIARTQHGLPPRVLHPIIVNPDLELLCGERGLRAAQLLGWETIPVIVRSKP